MRSKTATASFRLDEGALKALQEDARKQNISVNTLLNQLILTYANYDRPMKRFHMVKVSGSTFRHILQAARNETIVEAGNLAGKDGPKTSILATSGEVTSENALTYLKTMGDYSALFEIQRGNTRRKGERHSDARFRPQGKPLPSGVRQVYLRADRETA